MSYMQFTPIYMGCDRLVVDALGVLLRIPMTLISPMRRLTAPIAVINPWFKLTRPPTPASTVVFGLN